jgi:hypothetical protein
MCRLILLLILALAALLNVPVCKEAAAAPVTTAAQQEVATFGNGLRQNVYYYRGRNYRYRYGGHYYNHRYYKNNRWHYY